MGNNAGKALLKYPHHLLLPRQRRDQAQLVDRDRTGLAVDDEAFQHHGRQPGEACEAAAVAVGEAFVGGEIGERDGCSGD